MRIVEWEKGIRDFVSQGIDSKFWKLDKEVGHNYTTETLPQKNPKEFLEGDKVPLYRSKLKALRGRNRPKWFGPYTVKETNLKSETVIILYKDGREFTVSIQRVQPYDEGLVNENNNGKEVT